MTWNNRAFKRLTLNSVQLSSALARKLDGGALYRNNGYYRVRLYVGGREVGDVSMGRCKRVPIRIIRRQLKQLLILAPYLVPGDYKVCVIAKYLLLYNPDTRKLADLQFDKE